MKQRKIIIFSNIVEIITIIYINRFWSFVDYKLNEAYYILTTKFANSIYFLWYFSYFNFIYLSSEAISLNYALV